MAGQNQGVPLPIYTKTYDADPVKQAQIIALEEELARLKGRPISAFSFCTIAEAYDVDGDGDMDAEDRAAAQLALGKSDSEGGVRVIETLELSLKRDAKGPRSWIFPCLPASASAEAVKTDAVPPVLSGVDKAELVVLDTNVPCTPTPRCARHDVTRLPVP